jgi:SulP family sulfate permease
MLIAARLRVGMIADFLSKPVLVGYMTGAALILVSTQLEKLLGVKTHEHEFFPLLAELAGKLPGIRVPTFALGMGFLAVLGILRRVAPRLPGALVVFVLGIAASAAFDLDALGVEVVGDVPADCPSRCSLISRADLRDCFPARSDRAAHVPGRHPPGTRVRQQERLRRPAGAGAWRSRRRTSRPASSRAFPSAPANRARW